MSAFNFKFGKKKPVDFSKMKDDLDPNNHKDQKPVDDPDNVSQEPVQETKEPQESPKDQLETGSESKQGQDRIEAEGAPQSSGVQQEPRSGEAETTNEIPEPSPGQDSQGPPQVPEDPTPDSPKGPDPKPKPKGKGGGFKIVMFLLLLIVFIGLLVFVAGPKLMPKLAPNIANITEKIKLPEAITKLLPKQPDEEEFITPEEEAIEELVTVRTYRVARGDFVDVLPSMGTIKGDKEVELRFPVNGIVDSVNFFEGDLIRKGDIISTLEQKDALLKLEYSKSKLKTQEIAEQAAKKKLEIHQTLYDDGIIIKAKLEEVELEYKGAKSQKVAAQKEVEFALAELDKTYLYSPIDGVLGTRDVEVGEFVNSNVKVASIYDTSTVLAEMGVIEKDISRIALGQRAKVSVDTYPGVDFSGKIENIAPIIEGKSRTLTTKIRIKNNNPKGTLLPGMFARIWISVYEKKNTIKLPSSCVYDLDNNGEFDSVYAVDDDNIAKARNIKIGYISTDYVEIIDGLREGEQVVSEAMAELKDNVKVDVIEVQEPIL